jgi:uncharacterized protein involved in exopolysaccharide biosynthesis
MNARYFCGLAALIIGLLICVEGIWLLLSPVKYKAAAEIEIEPNYWVDGADVYYQPYDPDYIETEIKAIKSESILSNVVVALKLSEMWGKHYDHGTLDMNEAMQLLRWRLEIKALPDTHHYFQIGIWDEDPAQAARIANGIAQAYRDYRWQQYRKARGAGIEYLKSQYQKEAGELTNLQAQVKQLRAQAGITNADPPAVTNLSYVADYDAKQSLMKKEQLHELLRQKIQSEVADQVADPVFTEVIDPATPAGVVRSQHRRWGMILLICGLGLSGSGFHWLRTAGGRHHS